MVQYSRAVQAGNSVKMQEITNLMYSYGKALSSDEFEFELEKLLNQKEIFDTARDLI